MIGQPVFPRIAAFTLTAIALLAGLPAFAQAPAWPSKPVRVVVTLSPGSTSDILARVVSEQMGKSLGQAFVIENRPGAGGNIAGDYVAHQPADGYTSHALARRRLNSGELTDSIATRRCCSERYGAA